MLKAEVDVLFMKVFVCHKWVKMRHFEVKNWTQTHTRVLNLSTDLSVTFQLVSYFENLQLLYVVLTF